MNYWVKYIFIADESGHLRSGWRVAVFLMALVIPPAIWRGAGRSVKSEAATDLEPGIGQIIGYLPMVTWILIISWLCLALLEKKRPAALGLSLRAGWWKDFRSGLTMAALMVGAVFLLQAAGGGSRLALNPDWWSGEVVRWESLRHSLTETGWALALLILAAFFEELLYRGYAFQTLLRGTHPVLPVSLLSVLFGLSHLGNPNSTPFSTANTILAGIWLSVAYLRSGNLWFPAGLHLGWNVVLGPVLGLPVSGRLIPAHPVLLTSSIEPGWLTGGGYGSEGGAAATVVLLVAIFGVGRWAGRKSAAPHPAPPDNQTPIT